MMTDQWLLREMCKLRSSGIYGSFEGTVAAIVDQNDGMAAFYSVEVI
jgi:hypothetical protein